MNSTRGKTEICATTIDKSAADVAHFWFLVDDTAGIDACWPFLGTIQTGGYGQFTLGGKRQVAHRISYQLIKGPIPSGLQIDHLCFNRRCVNPAHLEAVTPRVNNSRSNSLSAHHALKTHCPAGHAYDQANTHLYQGRRYCRACHRLYSRSYRAKRISTAAGTLPSLPKAQEDPASRSRLTTVSGT